MSRTKLIIAGCVFVALTMFKFLFPEQSADIIHRAETALTRDIDYRAAFSRLGESIAVFSEEEPEAPSEESDLVSLAASPKAEAVTTLKLSDAAVNAGEVYAAQQVEELPTVVATFLESQSEYSDLGLPEDVSYDYYTFPTDFAVPVSGYNSSGFGYRLHPIHNEVRFHYGTDFAAWTGEAIHAFAGGTVSFAGYSDSFGNYISIDHGEGWESLYAHCSTLYVSTGDTVSAGELIALVGDTGLVTGPHLHFELSHEGVYVNPEYYVNG